MKRRPFVFLGSASLALALVTPSSMQAVPSYARQTGLPCSGCHYAPPELNPAGRHFKLTGYTDRKAPSVNAEPTARTPGLDILASLPLSAWFETSFTSTDKPQQGTQNGNFEFPQDVSLFLAGAWSTHVGSFLQVTYSTPDDHFSMDNTDIRFAKLMTTAGGKEFVYGLTLNNNPTVEDLWNSTPAWGFPFMASDVAPTPSAAPILQSLGQDVAGIGGYAMWNGQLYAAATLYRTEHVGGAQPNPGTDFAFNIRGVAPYWRVAWQYSSPETQVEVGSFGMYMKSTPNGVIGLEDKYTDWAFDAQVDQTLFRTDVLSLRASYIRENSDLAATLDTGGAQQSSHRLSAFQANAEYHLGYRVSGTIGWFNTTGTTDPLLFAQAPIAGSANGDPHSAGFIGNLSWWPTQNLEFAAQYIAYSRFNGAKTNYDGAGRDAGDNNTLYLLGRFIF